MSRIKEVICICCPCGCHLQVDPENDYNVTGNACPNGAAYGREELTHPTRILTSTVRVEGGLYPRCPVKTAQAVPKEKMTEVMAALDRVTLHAPVRTGQVVLADVCGTGVDVVSRTSLRCSSASLSRSIRSRAGWSTTLWRSGPPSMES